MAIAKGYINMQPHVVTLWTRITPLFFCVQHSSPWAFKPSYMQNPRHSLLASANPFSISGRNAQSSCGLLSREERANILSREIQFRVQQSCWPTPSQAPIPETSNIVFESRQVPPKMSVKWKSPLLDWEERNQDPNLAFTLVARNEAGRQMWADPRNSSRYVPASFTRQGTRDPSLGPIVSEQPDPDSRDEQPRRKKTKDTEPALQFLFNNWPKNFAKEFVLGSSDKLCDALLGDGEGCISEQTLAFTFNIQHELIMEVVSDDLTWVKYKGQKGAVLGRFTWIFPRGQEPIRIQVAGVIEFDVVLPEYGINKGGFYENCRSFLSSAAVADLLPDSLQADSTVLTRQASGISGPQKSFYLRGKVLGSGAYGEVHKALRMPDGKFYAAKRLKDMDSFSQEADMLKKVCKNYHVSTMTMR